MIRKLGVVTSLFVLFFGCGSDSISVKQAAIDRGSVLCHELFRCMATFPSPADDFTALFGTDEIACNASVAILADKYETAEKKGTLIFAGDNYQTCTRKLNDFLSSLSCDTFWTNTDMSSPPPECDMPFIGKVPDGGTCAVDEECMNTSSICNGASQCEPILDKLGRADATSDAIWRGIGRTRQDRWRSAR